MLLYVYYHFLSPQFFFYFSAGIGRTGTFIGLDAVEKQGIKTGCVNIKDYVHTMRKDRMNMIQTAVSKLLSVFII